jgi:hypothetical protein
MVKLKPAIDKTLSLQKLEQHTSGWKNVTIKAR